MYAKIYQSFIHPFYETVLRGRKTFVYLKELEKSQWFSEEKLKKIQWEKITKLIRHAYETVPYYRKIFKDIAQSKGVKYSNEGLAFLIQEWYIKPNRKLRGSHPREICDQILDISNYMDVEPEMTKELINCAAGAYFVKM